MATKFTQLLSAYRVLSRRYDQRQATLAARAKALRSELEAVEKQQNSLPYPHYIDRLIRPIGRAVLAKLPGYAMEIAGPFGLANRTSIHFEKKKRSVRGPKLMILAFCDPSTDEGLRLQDFSQDTGRFPRGSIGEMNGGNHPTVPVPGNADVDFYLRWMRDRRMRVRLTKRA